MDLGVAGLGSSLDVTIQPLLDTEQFLALLSLFTYDGGSYRELLQGPAHKHA